MKRVLHCSLRFSRCWTGEQSGQGSNGRSAEYRKEARVDEAVPSGGFIRQRSDIIDAVLYLLDRH